jgi:hypothetical protein
MGTAGVWAIGGGVEAVLQFSAVAGFGVSRIVIASDRQPKSNG